MKFKQHTSLAIFALLFTLLLSACGGDSSLDGVQMQESPLLRILERKSGLIAFIGLDQNIYTINQAGSNLTPVTTDADLEGESGSFRLYQKFTWSPAENRLAFTGVEFSETEQRTMIHIADPDGGNLTEFFTSQVEVPQYLSWSPDGLSLGFLTSDLINPLIRLYAAPIENNESLELIAEDFPIYWSWEPQGGRILTHTGGAASRNDAAAIAIHTPGSEFARNFELNPGFFQAPAWSPEGTQLLVAVEDVVGAQVMLITSLQGNSRQQITDVNGSIAFSWSPDGRKIAYINSERTFQGAMGPLTIVDLNKREDNTFTTEQQLVGAFFWSPDGEKIAFFAPKLMDGEETDNPAPRDADILIDVFVLDLKKEETRFLGSIFPTQPFLELLAAFDQYNQTATIWSPDNENIVVAGYTEQIPVIWVLAASGNLQPRPIAEGFLALWSWQE